MKNRCSPEHAHGRHAQARSGLLALEALTGAGVDPRRGVIAHAGDSNDLDYLRAIADTGASLGFATTPPASTTS